MHAVLTLAFPHNPHSHFDVVVGHKANEEVWPQVHQFLEEHDDGDAV